MKILVTGAAGFIASHLVERLARADHEVVAVDRREPPKEVRACSHFLSLDLVHADLTEIMSGVDVVVHLAAKAGLVDSWRYFPAYLLNNVLATERLLQSMISAAVPWLVYVSSSSVYGIEAVGNEVSPLKPISPYGVTKLAAEHLCRAYCEDAGISLTTIRPFSVYGPRQRPDMFHRIAIDALLNDRQLIIEGKGQQVRSNVYVADLVEAIRLALENEHAVRHQVLNISGQRAVSLLDTVKFLEFILGCKANLAFKASRRGDQRRTDGDTRKAYDLLNWCPTTTLEEGLRKQVQWQSSISAIPQIA